MSVQTPAKTSETAKVGDWWAPCCRLDLHQIKDEDDLHAMRKWVRGGGPFAGVWATEEEALEALEPWS